MKIYRLKFFLATIYIISLGWTIVPKQNYSLADGVMELSGKTSFDNWKIKSNNMQSDGQFSLISGKLAVVSPFNFSIPVKSFESANKFRDRSIYKYLKSYPNDQIYFRHVFTSIRPLGKSRYLLKITGNVNIAGITQVMILNLRCTAYTDSLLLLSGTTVMKMSKFQIFPKNLPAAATYNDNVKVVISMRFKPYKQRKQSL
ncbi:MAG: YceI family protein [Flavobacterium sp.]|nr:YceI family protein [Pedobacter sp.]